MTPGDAGRRFAGRAARRTLLSLLSQQLRSSCGGGDHLALNTKLWVEETTSIWVNAPYATGRTRQTAMGEPVFSR